jgi:hypothetical protein
MTMHTKTLDAWRHEHVFLGARHCRLRRIQPKLDVVIAAKAETAPKFA